MLLAKSADGKGQAESLRDHSRNVLAMARLLYHRLTPVLRSQDGLLSELEAAALLHDIGKAAYGFQEWMKGQRANWNGWRHELISAGFASNLKVPEAVIFAVMTHHRQIPGSDPGASKGRLHWVGGFPEDWPRMIEDWLINESSAIQLWNELCDLAERPDLKEGSGSEVKAIALDPAWLDRMSLRRQRKLISQERRIKASLLRGLLMSADHLASAGKSDIPEPVRLGKFLPKFGLRNFQTRCRLQGNVILNAPTGSGKTEAALLWAAENQVENGRFFYTLPYTAALNAMHGRLRGEFPQDAQSIGLLHGKAAHHLYEAAQRDYSSDPSQATNEALARTRLAREAFYPVRVCTPHQLLRFTLRGKGWEQMLSEIPGSCIVFDEVHSYDASLAGLTLGTARLFAGMGARLMFASATLPHFMRENIRKVAPMVEIAPDPNDGTDREVLDRKRHVVVLIDDDLLGLIGRIVEAAESERHVLVVCNHVGTAQTVARALRAKLGNSEGKVCLFHGRFNMEDRKRKESGLCSEELPHVLVATQVVEVSLDISFDVGFFEAAPIDALVQRMGRVNRQGKSPVPIFIALLQLSRHEIYESRYVKKTVELLSRTEGPLSEQDLTRICDEVYAGGYTGKEKQTFEDRLNHPFLERFEDNVVAGEHNAWIDTVIEDKSGRADMLPLSLKTRYEAFVSAKRWLDADGLLVNAYTLGLGPYLDKTGDPWTVDLKYDHEGLHHPQV
jgi:CRISPR-associated endonuclease/helicase Cas3